MRCYAMFGLRVYSEVPLPVPAIHGGERSRPACVIRRAPPGQVPPVPDGPVVASTPCRAHGVDQVVHRGPGGAWIWHRAVGTCHVHPLAHRVDVYPELGADDRVVGLLLASQVAVYVLHQLGYPTLHASAVTTPQGAVAFLGPKGQGKSTMAATFLRRGSQLLTDDVLPLHVRGDAIYAVPALPIMKLWRQAAERTLGVTGELESLVPNYDKKLLSLGGRLAFAQAPARLHAFYLLERRGPATDGPGIAIRPLSRREALSTLLAQVSFGAFLHPAEAGQLLPVYARLTVQAPVQVLSYPSSFEHQEVVHRALLADLEARR